METINERISKIIEHSKYSNSEFADEIDVPRSSISHISSGRNKPSLEFIMKIKKRFPELSWDWIIAGDGQMENVIPDSIEKKTQDSKPSLPDLFSIISDENFGKNDHALEIDNQRELPVDDAKATENKIIESQPLEIQKTVNNLKNTENQYDKVKRIVFFYENGKFESFEP